MNIDTLFQKWQSSQSEDALNELLTSVRSVAVRASGGGDDVAQEVSLVVLDKLSSFTPRSESAFGHWVQSITSKIRKGEKRKVHRRREDSFDEAQIANGHSSIFLDLNECPKPIREIAAKLLHGYSVEEIADQLGVKPDSVRKKVSRWCPESGR